MECLGALGWSNQSSPFFFSRVPGVGLKMNRCGVASSPHACQLLALLRQRIGWPSTTSQGLLWMEEGFNRLYNFQVGPRRVVGKAQHIRAFDVPYSTI
ncbi:hypothetical protein GW17_00051410 [Ensete ventricosum]|nr:hypothetical protein GW17_00051410 [Ensete ventricosum]